MRRLTYLILFLAVLYGGYWFVGANRVTNGVENALTQLQSDGWTADATVTTKGFPSRFDTTLRDVTFGDPGGRWQYEAPFLQALALSYRPNNVILILPPEQRISGPADAGTLTVEQLRASATVQPNLALAFDDLTAEGTALTYASDEGWAVTVDKLLSAARLKADSVSRYDVYTKIDEITLPGGGGVITTVLADADVRLQAPLDRTTQEVIVEQIVVNALRVEWGDVVLSGQGQLDVDAAGLPNGQIGLKIENWRDMLPRLVDAGLIDADLAQTAANMGTLLAAGQDTMVLPLKYENGFGSLGPLPLGPAPRLHFTR